MDHEKSPTSSFLSNRTSFLLGGFSLSKDLKTLSKSRKRVRRTWRCHWVRPCDSPMKSSRKTSTYAKSWALVRRRRVSRDKEPRVVSYVGSLALKTAADLPSILCGCEGECAQRAWLAKLATVYVAVQNKVGKFSHPIGGVRGVETSGLVPSSIGKMSPSFEDLAGRRLIW